LPECQGGSGRAGGPGGGVGGQGGWHLELRGGGHCLLPCQSPCQPSKGPDLLPVPHRHGGVRGRAVTLPGARVIGTGSGKAKPGCRRSHILWNCGARMSSPIGPRMHPAAISLCLCPRELAAGGADLCIALSLSIR